MIPSAIPASLISKARALQNAAADLHIIRFYSSFVLISAGRVVALSDPVMRYCPLAHLVYDDLRTADKNDLSAVKHAIRAAVESKIAEFGFFTAERKLRDESIAVPYGASEMLMYGLRKKAIDAAVVVCDGAGTVVTSEAAIVQGIGARMNGLFYTTPIPAVIDRLRGAGCGVFDDARIRQADGVRKAIEEGYTKIAVTLNACMDEPLDELRRLEKESGVSVTIIAVCTTGVTDKRIDELARYADLVWACGSGPLRDSIGKKALLQLSVRIPVFVLTKQGMGLAASYISPADALGKMAPGTQYLVSNDPAGVPVQAGVTGAFLLPATLPVRSTKEPS